MTSDDEPPTQPRESGGQDRKQREKRSRKEPLSQVSEEREAGNVEAEDGGEGLEHEIRNGKRREKDGRDRGDVPAALHLDRGTLIVLGLRRRDGDSPARNRALPAHLSLVVQ